MNSLLTDHFIDAVPVRPGSMVFKATHLNGSYSAVEVFPFKLTDEQDEYFRHQMILLAKATSDYRASIPELLSWGLTKTEAFPYSETEWIEGQALDQLVDDKGIDIHDIMVMAEQLSRTLSIFEQLGLQHGGVKQEHILWESRKNRYVLVGFNPMAAIAKETEYLQQTLQPEKSVTALNLPAGSQHNDIYDFGVVLFQLIKGQGVEIDLKEIDQNATPIEQSDYMEAKIPTWLEATVRKSLSTDPRHRFRNASELYNYVLSHHSTQVQKKSWYRSKPQQEIKSVKTPPEPASGTNKLQDKSQTVTPKNRKPFFGSYIIGGVLLAVIVMILGMDARRKNRTAGHDPAVAIAMDTIGHLKSDTTISAIDKNGKKSSQPDLQQKRKTPARNQTKKPVAVSSLEKDLGASANNPSAAAVLGAYRVRSKAHFHNQPDESTRRNAFIVHWNNAILHPSQEQNDFVYIVFTNHEGQTSKGWLRKKDLIRVEE